MTTYPASQPMASARRAGLLDAVRRHPLIAYFSLAFLWTWALLWPFGLDRNPMGLGLIPAVLPQEAFFLAFVMATFGPLFSAVFVTGAREGKPGVRRLLGRMVQWRVGLRWYLAALVSFFVVFFVVYLVTYPGASMAALIEKAPLLLTLFLPGILSQLLIPSLGEEPGWRGFALPRMQARYGPVAASIMLGALHGLWHLPVMFTFALGPFSATTLITFVLTAIGGTVIYTWIVNHARGSILIAMLIHAGSNSASQFLAQLLPADTPKSALAQALGENWVVTLAFALAAVLLVVATRGRLGYRPALPAPEA